MPDDSWLQASLAIDAGGLGMRETQAIALPAFIASRVAARPLVAEMAQHTEEAGLCPAVLCMRTYDARTTAACVRWALDLLAAVHGEGRQLLDDAAELAARGLVEKFRAQERWACIGWTI